MTNEQFRRRMNSFADRYGQMSIEAHRDFRRLSGFALVGCIILSAASVIFCNPLTMIGVPILLIQARNRIKDAESFRQRFLNRREETLRQRDEALAKASE